jgi:hypothetical protein
MQQLTERQAQFIEETKVAFKSPQWSVSSYPKRIDNPGDWITFKYQLLDFCMENGFYFLEKENFFHVGKSHNVCEYADTKLIERLSEKPLPATMVANQVEDNLN